MRTLSGGEGRDSAGAPCMQIRRTRIGQKERRAIFEMYEKDMEKCSVPARIKAFEQVSESMRLDWMKQNVIATSGTTVPVGPRHRLSP